MKFHLSQFNVSKKSHRFFRFDGSKLISIRSSTNRNRNHSFSNQIKSLYVPLHVPTNFVSYSSRLFLQNSIGSAAYVLSTNALLTSVGVGSATALPLAATINWVLKDGIGSLAMIGFAGITNQQRFDSDAKRTKWRADVLFNVGVFLELTTPLVPHLFLPLASLANLAKGIGGLAAGASKASLHKSLALKDNLGDVTAKLYSQGITAYLVGMLIGIQTNVLFDSSKTMLWTCFASFVGIHLFASYKALKNIYLKSLNQQRLLLCIDHFQQHQCLPTPKQLSLMENFIASHKSEINLTPCIENFPIDDSQLNKTCFNIENNVFIFENYDDIQLIALFYRLHVGNDDKLQEFLQLYKNSEYSLNLEITHLLKLLKS